MTEQQMEQRLMRLRQEKALIMGDMARPGFQLILRKLQELSDAMLLEYDKCQTLEEIMRIQAYRDVVETIIPKALESILSVDEPERWSFKGWIKDIWHCVDDFICHGWIEKAKRLFKA